MGQRSQQSPLLTDKTVCSMDSSRTACYNNRRLFMILRSHCSMHGPTRLINGPGVCSPGINLRSELFALAKPPKPPLLSLLFILFNKIRLCRSVRNRAVRTWSVCIQEFSRRSCRSGSPRLTSHRASNGRGPSCQSIFCGK